MQGKHHLLEQDGGNIETKDEHVRGEVEGDGRTEVH